MHPLLLEPGYWRDRLEALTDENQGLFFTPRPGLSGAGVEVTAFRVKAHDGTTLKGLFARPTWATGDRPVRIRTVFSSEDLQVDQEAVRQGAAELVFTESSERPLVDRVLDVIRVCQIARRTSGIDGHQVAFGEGDRPESRADEFLIASAVVDKVLGA